MKLAGFASELTQGSEVLTISDEVSSARLPLDWLVTPAVAFNHPDEVLSHPGYGRGEAGNSRLVGVGRSRGRRGCVNWSAGPASP